MSKRRLRPEDQRAWSRVARSVRALPGVTVPTDPAPTAPPKERRVSTVKSEPPAFAALLEQSEPARQRTLATPADRSGEKRIRRGQTALGGRLDLHGHTQETARSALVGFVAHHRAAGARSVLVITGKGRAGGGILRQRLLDWLDMPDLKSHVSGYAQAHQKHGGAGAWYLFLRRL